MTSTDLSAAPDAQADHFRVDERLDLGQRCLRILVDRPAGAMLSSFAQSVRVSEPSYLTVQLDAEVHLELVPAFLECINHSCAPNVAFDMARLALVALRPLVAGEELTYFYPSTEWAMTQPFICACGSPECLHEIDGASKLAAGVLGRYALSPFITRSLVARDR
jgi:hypothetical protein